MTGIVQALLEGRKNRYMEMFTGLFDLLDQIHEIQKHREGSRGQETPGERVLRTRKLLSEVIDIGIKDLEREDRIIWFLRLVKLHYLNKLSIWKPHRSVLGDANMSSAEFHRVEAMEQIIAKAEAAREKLRRDLSKRMGVEIILTHSTMKFGGSPYDMASILAFFTTFRESSHFQYTKLCI